MSAAHSHPILAARLGTANAPAGVTALRFGLAAAAQACPGFESVLTTEERDRARRLLRPEDQLRAAASRAILRVQIALVLDRDPASLVLVTGPHGKPALADGAVRFNVSHSADHFVIAVSRLFEVGVDVEDPGLPRDVDAAARFALSTEEKAVLDELPDERRKLAFLRMWTAKEAALKALGVGFKRPMREVAIDPAGLDTLGRRAAWTPGSATLDGATVQLADGSSDGAVICVAALLPDAGSADVQPGANSFG